MPRASKKSVPRRKNGSAQHFEWHTGGDRAAILDLQSGGDGVGVGAVPPPLSSPANQGVASDLQAMQLRMALGYEMAERDFRSGITQGALLALIGTMADVPGRKSLVLLSEGLQQGPA